MQRTWWDKCSSKVMLGAFGIKTTLYQLVFWKKFLIDAYHIIENSFAVGVVQRGNHSTFTIWMAKPKRDAKCMYRIRVILISTAGVDHPEYYWVNIIKECRLLSCKTQKKNIEQHWHPQSTSHRELSPHYLHLSRRCVLLNYCNLNNSSFRCRESCVPW